MTDVIPDSKIAREELLEIAYALEKKSEHPLAKCNFILCKGAESARWHRSE